MTSIIEHSKNQPPELHQHAHFHYFIGNQKEGHLIVSSWSSCTYAQVINLKLVSYKNKCVWL